jgi:hypothetical protein
MTIVFPNISNRIRVRSSVLCTVCVNAGLTVSTGWLPHVTPTYEINIKYFHVRHLYAR